MYIHLCRNIGGTIRRKRNGQIKMQGTETISQITERLGLKSDTVSTRFRAKRNGGHAEFKGRFDAFSVPTPEQILLLFPELRSYVSDGNSARKATTKKGKSVSVSEGAPRPSLVGVAPLQEELEAKGWREEAFLKKLKLSYPLPKQLATIVYLHAGLVFYDLWTIVGFPGLILAAILTTVKHGCISVGINPKYERQAESTLYTALALDALAIFLHYPTFMQRVDEDLSADIGTFYTSLLMVMCAVVAVSCVWAALYFANDITHGAARRKRADKAIAKTEKSEHERHLRIEAMQERAAQRAEKAKNELQKTET